MQDHNYVLLTGPQEGPFQVANGYAAEGPLMTAVQRSEDRGEFCRAYALEHPHYATNTDQDCEPAAPAEPLLAVEFRGTGGDLEHNAVATPSELLAAFPERAFTITDVIPAGTPAARATLAESRAARGLPAVEGDTATPEPLVEMRVDVGAYLALPPGTVAHPDRECAVLLPNGETLKFWVAAELVDDEEGRYVDLNDEHLRLRGVYMEPAGGEVQPA